MEITNTLLLMAIGIPGILVATTVHEFTRALFSTILAMSSTGVTFTSPNKLPSAGLYDLSISVILFSLTF